MTGCKNDRNPVKNAPSRAGWTTGLVAGAVAGIVGGAPSMAHALLTGRGVLEPLVAAGGMFLPARHSPRRLALAGLLVHTALSLGWGVVLAHWLPRPSARIGATAGLAIAALDLGVVAGRWFPTIRALPQLPQVADHLLYGTVVGAVLGARR